jgi:phage baseplate assembly protein W
MADIDRRTGMVIDNYASAVQSVEIILSTRLGSRVMRREFGAGVVELLGRLMTARLFDVFKLLLAAAIDLWEPRFRVRWVHVNGSADELRLGTASVSIEVDYRPRGHLGDPTIEAVRSFDLNFANGSVRAS